MVRGGRVMARVAEHLGLSELEERFRTAKDPILARHVQVIWSGAGAHDRGSLGRDQLRAALDRAVARPLQCRGLGCTGRPAPAQWARAGPAQTRRVGALARPPGRSAARRRAVDERDSGALDGRRAWARGGLGPTGLGGSAADRLVDPEAAPASPQGGHARGGSRVYKKLDEVAAQEAARRPDLPVEVFATDEHRLGLKPVLRRVWAPKGERPIALGHRQKFRVWVGHDGWKGAQPCRDAKNRVFLMLSWTSSW